MTDFDKICDFQNLYKAHKAARRGKRNTREVIDFEMNLSENLIRISESLKNKTYRISGYYAFMIHDPKQREIHALHYIDRVVQHCLCDEVLAPVLDKKLIYDNSACRIGKGTHFSLKRLNSFLISYYNKYGSQGYFLKCDISKFFNNIDHEILKRKLKSVFKDEDILWLLFHIIDSFEVSPGKGLPMGNQSSQWFAVFYLDPLDRLIKENLHIRYYTRYMDDSVLIHNDKTYLKYCLSAIREYTEKQLKLELNPKTQIIPISNGVDYLGWHIYLSDSGKVIRKVKQQTKYKYKRKLKYMQNAYTNGKLTIEEINQTLSSYHAYLDFGDTYKLKKSVLKGFALTPK